MVVLRLQVQTHFAIITINAITKHIQGVLLPILILFLSVARTNALLGVLLILQLL